MLVRHILDDNDIKTLNNRINVSYVQSCEVTEGNFRAVKNLSTNKVTFKDITLIISYCSSNNTAQRNERHTRQILSHEL
jgi:aconitase B